MRNADKQTHPPLAVLLLLLASACTSAKATPATPQAVAIAPPPASPSVQAHGEAVPRFQPRLEELLAPAAEPESFALAEPFLDLTRLGRAEPPPETPADETLPSAETAVAEAPAPPKPAAPPKSADSPKPADSPPPVAAKPAAEQAAAPAAKPPQPVQSASARTAPPKPAVPAREEVPTESVSAESAEEFLRKAREAAASKRYAEAVGILDEFRAASPRLNAEAWWLYGQCLEAASPARDIKRALAAYTALTRQFPASGRYRAALNRIAYLDKFYFSIN